jgi:hypothetical protein
MSAGQAPGIGSERIEHGQELPAGPHPGPHVQPGAAVIVNPAPDPRRRGLHKRHDLGGIQAALGTDSCRHGIADQDVSDEDDSGWRPSRHIVNLYRPALSLSSDRHAQPVAPAAQYGQPAA